MSPSVAGGLLQLQRLEITDCKSMEEVITEEEQQGEGIITLFPLLEQLTLHGLPKLRHFFLSECTLEFPLLRVVRIDGCPEMKTFVQEGICVSLQSVRNDDEVKVDDLDKASMFNSKIAVQLGSISVIVQTGFGIEILVIRILLGKGRLERLIYRDFGQVSCPNLEELYISGINSISALFSHQLPTAYFSKLEILEVYRCKKLRTLMSPSVARGLLNLRRLKIFGCESMEEVISEEEQQGEGIITLFPLLVLLELRRLPKPRHFSLTEHALIFPSLTDLCIDDWPEMKMFVQQGISTSRPSLEIMNNDDEAKVVDLNKAMFSSKVSYPNLEKLKIWGSESISALCSHQLPTDNFSKLKELSVYNCGKLRNLMSPSVARGLRNLLRLEIEGCESMEEVITEEEQQGEGIITLFPLLEYLYLERLPKLRHFFLSECTLEFPSLTKVRIDGCPEMKTFVQQGISVSTPSLKTVNGDDEVKVDDLNKWTQQRFTSKKSEAADGIESEATDGIKSKPADDSKG